MASTIANILVKKTLKDVATKNINSTNPFEEEVPVYGRDGRPTGKVKKRKRALPVGLSQHDSDVLKKVRRRAYRLDMSLFNLCGIRFGWSSVVGIIPVIGDFIDALMAFMLVRTCATVEGGLPATLQSRMLFNVMLDFGIGLVPFIGDIADALYRANTRNAWLLEVYLTKKAEAERKNTAPMTDALPASPPAAKAPSRGGFFGSKRQPQDEEMAMSQIHDGRSAPPVGQKQQPQPQQQRDQAPQQSGVSTRR